MFFKKRRKKEKSQPERLEKISDMLLSLANHNFDVEYDVSDKHDDFDALLTGLTILGQELKQSTVSKEYLTSIYKGIVDMLIIIDVNGVITDINTHVEKTLVYKRSELIGQSFETVLDRPKLSTLVEVRQNLEKGGFSHNIELTFVTSHLRKIPVSCSASFLYNREKEVTGVLYIAKDISKIKETERQLRIKNREMDTFLYRSAHNLKGPIATILGLVGVINRDLLDVSSQKFLDSIQNTANELNKTLNRFSEFSKSNSLEVKIARVNWEDVIHDVFENWKGDEDINTVKLIQNITPSFAKETFFSSKEVIKCILENMIDNAVKYRNKQRESFLCITLAADKNHEGIYMIFEDNGVGIPPNKQEKIFYMFERASENSRGSGLGLYLVKKCLEKLGGSIQLKHSDSKGSSFQIFIPNKTILDIED